MKSRKSKSFLILFFLSTTLIYSNNSKNIKYSKENFTINIPIEWNIKKINSDSLIFKSNFKNVVDFYIFKNVSTSGNRPNIIKFSKLFKKKLGYLGFGYKTIKKGDSQFLKFYEKSNNKDKYILYYKREWNIVYTLFFHYKDKKQETTIKNIINSFNVSIPFKQVRETILFKNYFFSTIALIVFIFFGYEISRYASSLYNLKKMKKKITDYSKDKHLLIFNKRSSKYKRNLILNLLGFTISIYLFYSLTPISTSILSSTLLSSLFGLANPPDILEGFNNFSTKLDISLDAFGIDDFFDTDIDF